jgi:cytochrome c peroxidase
VDWRFLTARSSEALAPLLEAYGQRVTRERDGAGKLLDSYSHVLRVFLVDAAHRIRNVYTVSYLHQDTLMADIRTLLLEMDGPAKAGSTAATLADARLIGPGDDRRGYDSAGYRTLSRSLDVRAAMPLDLLAFSMQPRLGLPPLPADDAGPLASARIALGRKLFFDRRLSLNETISCAMCHVPDQGFTVNELATAVGIEGRTVRRNAPTLLNVAYAPRLFHDARENRLEQQVWSPLLAGNEMANPSVGQVIDKLVSLPDYQGLFEGAFGGRGPGMETVGMALASYERTLVAASAPFDRWFYGKDGSAIGDAARRGFELFRGKAGCAGCHIVGDTHALFSDYTVHNTGIGYARSMGAAPGLRRVQLAPGVFVDVDPAAVAASSEATPNDLGRYEVTQDPADRWKYRTPTLRNIGLTAPYMHDGSLPTLASVVDFYNRGGVPNPLLDPLIRPLGLSPAEVADLLQFLGTLDSPEVRDLVTDASAAPVGDRSHAGR